MELETMSDDVIISYIIDLTATIERNRIALMSIVRSESAKNILTDDINKYSEKRSEFKHELKRRLNATMPNI